MRTRRLVSLLAALALVLAIGSTASANGGRPYMIELLGANERPNPGDPDGSGTAWLTINPGLGEVCWTIEWSGIAEPFASHIHRAGPDVAGPVVVPLLPVAGGCTTADRELLIAIMLEPEGYYVNVHNAEYPAGALRGQLG
jgi:hypothetical protein